MLREPRHFNDFLFAAIRVKNRGSKMAIDVLRHSLLAFLLKEKRWSKNLLLLSNFKKIRELLRNKHNINDVPFLNERFDIGCFETRKYCIPEQHGFYSFKP